MKRRVVITGMGVVSPIGMNLNEYWDSLLLGRNGITKIESFDVSDLPCKVAGEIKSFDPTEKIQPKDARRMDRFSQFALYAAMEAAQDAGLTIPVEGDTTRYGVIIGSGIGGIKTVEDQMVTIYEKGKKRFSPFFIPMLIINIASGEVSIALGLKGPSTAVTTACATGTNAIGDAFRIVQRGGADLMFAGGAEAAITLLGVGGFSGARALSFNPDPNEACRPFDAKRDGFVMGEGAGVVVLEELSHAKKRGAKIYGEMVGYGMSSDAYHITAPDPTGDGAIRAIKAAIEDAGIDKDEIDYINAHGTSTPLNDKIETAAIKAVFGDRAYKIAISSTKSMTGHLLGAAGAIEFIAATMSVCTDKIHPTINYVNQDPDCDLDYVPNQMRERKVRAALSNSLGFGGHNATVIIKKFEE